MNTKLLMAVTLLTAQSLCAEGPAIGIKAGTLGAGIEVGTTLGDHFGVRISAQHFTYDYDDAIDGIDYNLDLELNSFAAMLDWHPFADSFRLSAGALYNANKLDAQANPAVNYDIGGITYTATDAGRLIGSVEFDDFAPYAGIGWDTSFDKEYGLGFLLELGVLFQGSPNVNLTADGALTDDPAFQAELEKEEASIQDELDEFKFYPVVTAGLIYRF